MLANTLKFLVINFPRKLSFSLFWFCCTVSLHSHAISDEQNYEKALLAFHQDEYQSSIIYLKNKLQETPSHLPSRVLMAENLLALGDARGAEIELNIALEGGADLYKTTPLLAKAYLIRQQYQLILDLTLAETSSALYKSEMLTYQGYAYLGQKDFVKASLVLNDALALVPDNVDAVLGLAKIQLHRENIAQALIFIEEALAIEPSNKQAQLMAAITYRLVNNSELALELLNKLIVNDPSNYSALLTRSMIYSELNDNEAALGDLNTILANYPDQPIANYIKLLISKNDQDLASAKAIELHLMTVLSAISSEVKAEQPIFLFLTGLVNFQNGAMENAQQVLLKYNKLAPNDIRGIKLLAKTQMALGNYFLAKSQLLNATLLDENDVETWSLIGRTSMMLNEIDKAQFYFEKVVEADNKNALAIVDLASLYLVEGEYGKAIAVLEPTANQMQTNSSDNRGGQTQQSQVLIMLLKALQETQQIDQALVYSKQLITLEPQSSYAYQIQGTLLALKGQIDKAQTHFIQAIDLDESNFQAVIFLARIYGLQGKNQQAIILLSKALEQGANSALYIELGDIYRAMNNSQESLVWYKKALSHNPSSQLALNKIVEEHIKNKNIDEAIKVTQGYILAFDKQAKAYEILAQLYAQKSSYSKALEAMTRFVKLSEDKAQAYYKLAQLQISASLEDSAIKSLKTAIEFNQDYQPAYLLLIAVYTENLDKENALAIISSFTNVATGVDGHSALILRLKADLYWLLEQPTMALDYYQESYNDMPTREALLGLYRVYRYNNDYIKITPLLVDWLAKNKNDMTMAISLAENYRDLGELQQASDYYQALLSTNADNYILLNNAALIEFALADYNQAKTLIDQAYLLFPNDVNIIDTKAWVELHLGNADTALALLREANTLDSENAEVKYHLAETLAKLDRQKEAKIYLREAVYSEQEFREKTKAKALLLSW